MRVATTERPHAIASSSAWPSGSTRLGWQSDVAAAIAAGISSCGTRPSRRIPVTPLELRAQRPVAGERQRALAEPRERVRETQDVLSLA